MIRKPSILAIAASCIALLAAPHADAAPGGKGGGKPDKHEKKDKHDHKEKNNKHNKKDKHDKKGKPDKHDKDDHGKGDKEKKDKPDNRFSDDERNDLIRLFSGKNNPSEGQLPPGLAKKLEQGKLLPPGWEKKLAVGNRIDNDFLPLLIPVPYEDLPRVRRIPGTQLYAHNDCLFLVRDATHEILDAILLR